MVTNAAYYFSNIFRLLQAPSLLEDYPSCGKRNNDTFNFVLLGINDPFRGSESTSDWGVECLWDCTWKINPYVGQTFLFTDPKNAFLQVRIGNSLFCSKRLVLKKDFEQFSLFQEQITLSLTKNERFTQKTQERIPNPTSGQHNSHYAQGASGSALPD